MKFLAGENPSPASPDPLGLQGEVQRTSRGGRRYHQRGPVMLRGCKIPIGKNSIRVKFIAMPRKTPLCGSGGLQGRLRLAYIPCFFRIWRKKKRPGQALPWTSE